MEDAHFIKAPVTAHPACLCIVHYLSRQGGNNQPASNMATAERIDVRLWHGCVEWRYDKIV